MRLDGIAGDPVSINDVDAVRISARVGRVPRRFTFADGSLFETGDNDAVDAWLGARRLHRGGLVHELERSIRGCSVWFWRFSCWRAPSIAMHCRRWSRWRCW